MNTSLNAILFLLLCTPLVGAVLSRLLFLGGEKPVSYATLYINLVQSLLAVLAVVNWLLLGAKPYALASVTLFQLKDYSFHLSLYLDWYSVVFLLVTVFFSALVTRFSQYYLHRELGYARFFSTVFILVFGMMVLATAGNFDVFFAGWEIVGVSSFLLISFYNHRKRPLMNAFKVFCVYRVCDVGLLVGAWLEHRYLEGRSDFLAFNDLGFERFWQSQGELRNLAISGLLILAAIGKSAQFPFSFWLARAMEGPTPSSAIFYGALSIHAGVLLLLRSYPLWHSSLAPTLLVGVVGALTAFLATGIGRTQSNIKGQIAYASVTQVGIMFLELACGFKTLALIHFVANAGLRCYQLLVSPSIVSYRLKLQGTVGYKKQREPFMLEKLIPNRLKPTLYVLAVSEGYLEQVLFRYGWGAVWKISSFVRRHFLWCLGFAMTIGVAAVAMKVQSVAGLAPLPIVSLCFAFFFGLRSLSETKKLFRVWNFTFAGQVSLALAVGAMNLRDHGAHVVFYLLGVSLFWGLGMVAFWLKRFYTKAYKVILFISFLGMSGFPIGPAFIGEDLLLHQAIEASWVAAMLIVFIFIINGIALLKTQVKEAIDAC